MAVKLTKTLGSLYFFLELVLIPLSIFMMSNQHMSQQTIYQISGMAITNGSIILCILMSYSCLTEKLIHIRLNNQFMTLVFLCSFALWLDLIFQSVDTTGMPGTNMLCATLYYIVGMCITYVFMMYIVTILDLGRHPRYKKDIIFVRILTLIGYALTIANIRFRFMFSVNENGMYVRTKLFWIAYLIPVIQVVFTVYIGMKENRIGVNTLALALFWTFPVIAIVIQIIFPKLSIQYTGFTISLVMIYYFIHTELETFDFQNKRIDKKRSVL